MVNNNNRSNKIMKNLKLLMGKAMKAKIIRTNYL